MLELAAFRAADFTAFDHAGARAAVRGDSAKEAQDVEEPFKLVAAAVKRAFDQSGEGLPGEEY